MVNHRRLGVYRGPGGRKHCWFRCEAAGRIVNTLRDQGSRTRDGGVRTRRREPRREDILVFMVDQGIHIIITYGTRGRHGEDSRAFYMHPIIIWSLCVLFVSTIEQSRQVIISQRLPRCHWLPFQHVIIRDYIYPHRHLYSGSMREIPCNACGRESD